MLLLLSDLPAPVSDLPGPAAQRATLTASSFQFGKVVQGTGVEHEFILKNDGNALLELGVLVRDKVTKSGVRLLTFTWRVLCTRMPR